MKKLFCRNLWISIGACLAVPFALPVVLLAEGAELAILLPLLLGLAGGGLVLLFPYFWVGSTSVTGALLAYWFTTLGAYSLGVDNETTKG